MSKSNGVVIYQGPSLIDGAPIVAIATGLVRDSRNSKTGAMVQTFIIRQDMHPVEAIKAGADSSICGDCRHRGDGAGKSRTCYVEVGKSVGQVWRAWRRGSYLSMPLDDALPLFRGRLVRFGAYGDPAAVPAEIWRMIADYSSGFTGYSHQWHKDFAQEHAEFCMASVDSVEELDRARIAGWRTFRVMAEEDGKDKIRPAESLCPASELAGRKLTCAECMACNGLKLGRRIHLTGIAIPQH